MKRLAAISFLMKSVIYISIRILKGYEWNMISVDLEEPGGGRRVYRYRRAVNAFNLDGYVIKPDGYVEVL